MLTTKTEVRIAGLRTRPTSSRRSIRRTTPGAQGDQQDRRGGEAEGPHRRARIGLTESGEEQRKERGGERRPGARSRLLRFLHRA